MHVDVVHHAGFKPRRLVRARLINGEFSLYDGKDNVRTYESNAVEQTFQLSLLAESTLCSYLCP